MSMYNNRHWNLMSLGSSPSAISKRGKSLIWLIRWLRIGRKILMRWRNRFTFWMANPPTFPKTWRTQTISTTNTTPSFPTMKLRIPKICSCHLIRWTRAFQPVCRPNLWCRLHNRWHKANTIASDDQWDPISQPAIDCSADIVDVWQCDEYSLVTIVVDWLDAEVIIASIDARAADGVEQPTIYARIALTDAARRFPAPLLRSLSAQPSRRSWHPGLKDPLNPGAKPEVHRPTAPKTHRRVHGI